MTQKPHYVCNLCGHIYNDKTPIAHSLERTIGPDSAYRTVYKLCSPESTAIHICGQCLQALDKYISDLRETAETFSAEVNKALAANHQEQQATENPEDIGPKARTNSILRATEPTSPSLPGCPSIHEPYTCPYQRQEDISFSPVDYI